MFVLALRDVTAIESVTRLICSATMLYAFIVSPLISAARASSSCSATANRSTSGSASGISCGVKPARASWTPPCSASLAVFDVLPPSSSATCLIRSSSSAVALLIDWTCDRPRSKSDSVPITSRMPSPAPNSAAIRVRGSANAPICRPASR